MSREIEGVTIPDSKLAREVTELIRAAEPDLLFHHSCRVYYFRGARRETPWAELRSRASLRERHASRRHGIAQQDIDLVWTAIALHTTEAVVQAHPRTPHFKEDIIQAFYDGIRQKPNTTFGNVKADVLADKEAAFKPGNFCAVIRGSAWRG